MINPFLKTVPMISLEKNTPYEKKDKWYLKDLCLLGLVYVLFNMKNYPDTADRDLLQLHKNKHRKELKKIATISQDYMDLRDRLILALSPEDRKRLSKITRGFAPIFFKMGENIKDINLETLSINIIVVRFQNRKNIHKDFEECKDFKKLFIIVEEIEKVGLLIDDGSKEYKFALEICEAINKY